MKIATWNVNSIRTRLEHVLDWLQQNLIDVLCLQETKVEDEKFPRSPFSDRGLYTYISGQRSYNGVALISRSPLVDVSAGFSPIVGEAIANNLDEHKRVISGVLDGIRIINLYVPNGSSVGSDKYAYKLRWFGVLQDYLKTLLAQRSDLLVCGDFNVALEDRDIHDPTGRELQVMATDAERAALTAAVLDMGLADAFRKFNQDGGHFSWWDYRQGAFRRNMGWRIDHHYLSPSLYEKAIACTIDVAPRKLVQPSDHAPVIVEF